MADKSMSDRQRYWLGQVKAADMSDGTIVDYARAHKLKVKDLYQWKTKLIKLGFYGSASLSSNFVPVRPLKPTLAALSLSPSVSGCTVIYPNGVRLEFQDGVSPEVIRELVLSASNQS